MARALVVARAPPCPAPLDSRLQGNDGKWLVGGVARCGGRRCPPPGPGRRPRGIAPTGAGGHKGSPLRFVWQGIASTMRAGGWACGLCRGRPYDSRFYGNDGVVDGVARVGGRRFPPAGPRQAPTRDRPYGGGRPQGIAPTVRVARDRLYDACRGMGVRVVSGRAVRFPFAGE